MNKILSLEGVAGNIEVNDWSFGSSQRGSFSGGGSGSGKVNMQDFHFTKKADQYSSLLFEYCTTGKLIPSAKINSSGKYIDYDCNDTQCKPVSKEANLSIKLTDIQVSSMSSEPAGNESVTFTYKTMAIDYSKTK